MSFLLRIVVRFMGIFEHNLIPFMKSVSTMEDQGLYKQTMRPERKWQESGKERRTKKERNVPPPAPARPSPPSVPCRSEGRLDARC